MFSNTVNGADFVTRALFSVVDGDRAVFLLIHLVLAIAFVTALLLWRRRHRVKASDGLLMVVESAVYALTIGAVIVFVVERLVTFSVGDWGDVLGGIEAEIGTTRLGPTGAAVVTSLGAGVYEELLFRLGLFIGGASLLVSLGLRAVVAILVAAVLSSILFSFAHHLGPYGEPFEVSVFIFRLLAGLAFAAICYWRSFAHAVYTHFLYDTYVLVLRT